MCARKTSDGFGSAKVRFVFESRRARGGFAECDPIDIAFGVSAVSPRWLVDDVCANSETATRARRDRARARAIPRRGEPVSGTAVRAGTGHRRRIGRAPRPRVGR